MLQAWPLQHVTWSDCLTVQSSVYKLKAKHDYNTNKKSCVKFCLSRRRHEITPPSSISIQSVSSHNHWQSRQSCSGHPGSNSPFSYPRSSLHGSSSLGRYSSWGPQACYYSPASKTHTHTHMLLLISNIYFSPQWTKTISPTKVCSHSPRAIFVHHIRIREKCQYCVQRLFRPASHITCAVCYLECLFSALTLKGMDAVWPLTMTKI